MPNSVFMQLFPNMRKSFLTSLASFSTTKRDLVPFIFFCMAQGESKGRGTTRL